MVDYIAAIKKPFEDVTTLAIGTVVGLIPIVNLLNTGYGVLTAKNVLAGDKKLLAWDTGKLVDMVVSFIMVAIISIIYMIPGLILFFVGLAGALTILAAGIANPSAAGAAILSAIAAGGIFLLIGGLLWLVAVFLLPMAIMNYIKNNNIGAAFSFGTIIGKVLKANYIVSWIVMIVYAIVLGILALVISIIPVVGIIIAGGLVSFLSTVTGYSIFAETYEEK